MAIANIIGRGVGFGSPSYIVTHGYGDFGGGPPVVAVAVPSPHRLAFDSVATDLTFKTANGTLMATPFYFTATETGPVTLRLTGARGTTPDLTTAESVTFSLMDRFGTLVADAVSLTDLTDEGTGVWTRLEAEVATPGDYIGQVTVVDADGNVSVYPDAKGKSGFSGAAITMLRPVGG